jgi:hypothetical protein
VVGSVKRFTEEMVVVDGTIVVVDGTIVVVDGTIVVVDGTGLYGKDGVFVLVVGFLGAVVVVVVVLVDLPILKTDGLKMAMATMTITATAKIPPTIADVWDDVFLFFLLLGR